MHKIIKLLQINESKYNNMLLDFGILYCEHYTAGDAVGCANLKTSKHFWIWWTNQYRNIDSEFFKNYSSADYSVIYFRSKYERMHDPKIIQVYPSDYVIKCAFGGMLKGKRQSNHSLNIVK